MEPGLKILDLIADENELIAEIETIFFQCNHKCQHHQWQFHLMEMKRMVSVIYHGGELNRKWSNLPMSIREEGSMLLHHIITVY